MKHFDLPHRSADWFTARAGLATTSNFDKIITKTGKDSAQADAYANLLIAELILNRPFVRDFSAYALEWGEQYEAEAVALYKFETGLDPRSGGFFTNDAMTYGASPDARVFDGETMVGLAEIKCPENPANHIEFLLMDEMNPKYIPQVQGQLLVSGAAWVDWFSYYPELPSARIRVHRDEKYITLLQNALTNFDDLMQSKIQQMVKMGHISEAPKKHITDEIVMPPQAAPQEGIGY
jgi:hypothetical protein